jgi:MFS family permease
MCAYSFTVFVSVFQLLPTAPYHVIELGGSTFAAGLFLGFLTFASAASAPFTGAIGDRIGQRRVLIFVSVILAVITASYAVIQDYRLMLAVVVIHGLFWSGLLAASGAYMTSSLPASRRAEGIGYWGLASVLAVGTAPAIGFWMYRHGWVALCIELTILNVLMAAIAWKLPDDHHGAHGHDPQAPHMEPHLGVVEWRVLLLSVALAMVSFGYGGLTSFSALYADDLAITPRSVFLSAMAVSILAGRLLLGRSLDRIGHRKVLTRCLILPPLGLLALSLATGRLTFIGAGLLFGAGFGLMHPAFTAYVMAHVPFRRRGAAFGAMLAAFDTGIGTGSSTLGWVIHHVGFRKAFGLAALLAALALPAFVYLEKRWGTGLLDRKSEVRSQK